MYFSHASSQESQLSLWKVKKWRMIFKKFAPSQMTFCASSVFGDDSNRLRMLRVGGGQRDMGTSLRTDGERERGGGTRNSSLFYAPLTFHAQSTDERSSRAHVPPVSVLRVSSPAYAFLSDAVSRFQYSIPSKLFTIKRDWVMINDCG